ncbi:MAG: ribosome silencing factor [Flavobacteriales bacterium]
MAKKLKKENTEILLSEIIEGMTDVKAHDIVVMDLRKIDHAMSDYFIVCHGTSSTQVEAIARSIEKVTHEKLGQKPYHVEGKQNAQWVLMDYFDIIVHIFNETTRKYYALEELWADAAVERVEQ